MQYVGSKQKLAKYLIPFILNDADNSKWYIEPFVGSFGMMTNVYRDKRIANDINFYLIEVYKAIIDGWIPPEIVTEDQYNDIKNNKTKYDPWVVGFVRYACSFAGKWFGGYARTITKKGIAVNFALRGKNSLLKKKENLNNIVIHNTEYKNFYIPPESIIYCDPPYKGTTPYKGVSAFDHEVFYDWCREMKTNGHKIFVSEYNMPDDFVCIWQKPVKITINSDGSNIKHNIEKLYTL